MQRERRSKNLAIPLLLPLGLDQATTAIHPNAHAGTAVAPAGSSSARSTSTRHRGGLRLDVPAVVGDDGEDGALEDLVDAAHLLAAALHVLGAHLLGDG